MLYANERVIAPHSFAGGGMLHTIERVIAPHSFTILSQVGVCYIIIIIKRISRAPIYHTRWQHRVLYNSTNHTHTHTHTHTHY